MLNATLRRVSLCSESYGRASTVRQFILSSRCASGASIPGVEPASLWHSHSETYITSADNHGYNKHRTTCLSDSANSKTTDSSLLEPDKRLACTDGPSTTQTSSPTESKKTAKSRGKESKPRKPRFVNPPSPKIETFLQSLESESDTLTLEDAETFRPSQIPDTRSPRYEVEYNKVKNNLIQSFNLITLRKIFDLYSIPHLPGSSQRKIPYAQAILEHWGWKPVSVVKEGIMDVTKSSELGIPLSSEEAFLLMGKDGVELLNLAKRYSVHLSFTGHPISLKAKGMQGSLKRLKGYLNSFKKDIKVETASLNLGHILPFEITKSLSRLSGAYITQEGDKIQISYHKSQPHCLEVAKRLVVQAASRDNADDAQSVYLNPGISPNNSSPYSLYPFTPQQQLPWDLSSSSSFRLRRVSHWLETVHPSTTLPDTGLHERFGPSDTLKADLICSLTESSRSITADATLEISACSGHFLFLSSSKEHTLLPPMIGQLEADDIRQWIRKYPEQATFNHCVPAAALACIGYKEQHILKLVYVEQRDASEPNRISALQLEIPYSPDNVVESIDKESQTLQTRCFSSKENNINILIPDCPADIKLSAVRKCEILSSDLPRELSTFVSACESGLRSNPSVPLAFSLNGSRYALKSNQNIRREFKTILLGDKYVNVITETSKDADINQHGALCKIICEDYNTTESWENFLRTCNNMASIN